jgi:hypothetical protein
MLVAGCQSPYQGRPPYEGPRGVWSHSPVQGAQAGGAVERYAPAVQQLLALPYAPARPQVWVLPERTVVFGNARTTTIDGERVILLGQAAFQDLDRIVAHELVHCYLMDLPRLPAAIEEGFADVVTCILVPESLEWLQRTRLTDLRDAPSLFDALQVTREEWAGLTLTQDQYLRARGWEQACKLGRARLLELIAEARIEGREEVPWYDCL